ncbi:MAG: DUF7546 family protein [Haloferacaceae archaeon]
MTLPAFARNALSRDLLDRETLLAVALLVNTQLAITLAYLVISDSIFTELRYLVYPWLWIDAAILAVWKTDLAPASTRTRRIGLAIAGGYVLLLAVAGGLVGPAGGTLATLTGTAGPAPDPTGLSVHWLPPGSGPAVLYQGSIVSVTLLPYEVIGYAGLAYLVYAGVLETAGSTVSGLVGVFSCVSCAWPVVGGLVTTVFGSSSAIAVAATTWPYDVSTIVFLSAVALLYWRPSW